MASDLLQRRSGTTTLMFITTQEEEYELLIKITSSKVYFHNSELWSKNINVAWKLLTRFNPLVVHNSTSSLYVYCVIFSSVFGATCSMYNLFLLFFISNKVQIFIKAIFNVTIFQTFTPYISFISNYLNSAIDFDSRYKAIIFHTSKWACTQWWYTTRWHHTACRKRNLSSACHQT